MLAIDARGRHVTAAAPPRKAARDVRAPAAHRGDHRRALARKGFAALTVADVAQEAGLSPGIVIFHFTSKDELLAAVLSFLADRIPRALDETGCGSAGPSAAERMKALLLCRFRCQRLHA